MNLEKFAGTIISCGKVTVIFPFMSMLEMAAVTGGVGGTLTILTISPVLLS